MLVGIYHIKDMLLTEMTIWQCNFELRASALWFCLN